MDWSVILVVVVVVVIIIVVWLGLWAVPPRTVPASTEESALLARITHHTSLLVDTLYLLHPHDPRIQRLRQRYRPDQLWASRDHQTYTVNKGEQIVLCVRNYAQEQKLHDDFNLLMFVVLHELAHVITESQGHTPEFWDHFQFLLRQAAEQSYYDPVNYALDPVSYCAMTVYENPYFYERTPEEFRQVLNDLLTGGAFVASADRSAGHRPPSSSS